MRPGTRAQNSTRWVKYVAFDSMGTAHEWLTWQRDLHEFAPMLFRESKDHVQGKKP